MPDGTQQVTDPSDGGSAENPGAPGAGMPCVDAPVFGPPVKDPSSDPGFMALAFPELFFSTLRMHACAHCDSH